jgi:peptidoglycan hydrolase CwlO-like protein
VEQGRFKAPSDGLTSKTKIMSRQPVKHTCPDIDKVIKAIENAVAVCNDRSINEDNYRDALKDIEDYLWRLDDTLEELRSSNDALRSWGEEEATKVNELETEVSNLENQIEELQNQTTTA